MIICMVGDFSSHMDEGYKNTSHSLANLLEKRHSIARLNTKQVGEACFWRGLHRLKPDIIHTIAQPTNQSLLLTRVLRQLWPNAKAVVSALRGASYFPRGQVGLRHQCIMRLTSPDLVLVQNNADAALFRRLGCTVEHLANGVDLERFRPATPEQKRSLRLAYGLDPDRPVVLHVGHLIPDRNLLSLRRLPAAGIQVLVAGSLYMGTHYDLISELEVAGYHVLAGYQPHVEELYMLSDLYVFPPWPGTSLSMPLSVLEAMACNLPVLATRFSGLQHAFQDGDGFRFLDSADDLLPPIREVLTAPGRIRTRDMVQPYAWQTVVSQLEKYYEGVRQR